jgi:BioD-like phosphotransacetylase family protein
MFSNTHPSMFNNNSLIQHPKRNIKFKKAVQYVIASQDDENMENIENKVEELKENIEYPDIYMDNSCFDYSKNDEVKNENIVISINPKHNELKKSNSIKMFDICKKVQLDKKFSKQI